RPPPLDPARRRAPGRVAALRAPRVRRPRGLVAEEALGGVAEAGDGVGDAVAGLLHRAARRGAGAADRLADLVGHAGDRGARLLRRVLNRRTDGAGRVASAG